MKINDDVIKVIIKQAKKDAPIECCGLLLGKDDVVMESYWMSRPSQFEGNFISLCHTDEILDYVLKSIEESIE